MLPKMITIPDHKIITTLFSSSKSIIYRGLNEHHKTQVILKILKSDSLPTSEQAKFRQEFQVIQKLDKIQGVIRALDLMEYHGNLVMILEDIGADSLNNIDFKKLNLSHRLKIAVKIARVIAEIHGIQVIHKDINPANIILNQTTGQLKLIDFGISSFLSRETPMVKSLGVLEGTLSYISPEQTGRMNRSLDYRTDFYSFGITLYELFTGRLPFLTDNPPELVHCHIAREPVAPHALNPEIPKTVSDIIMKLISKNSEERYQSSIGIIADLDECLTRLKEHQKIFDFAIGLNDISDRFHIPQKLYGRELEIETLMSAFDRVIHGKNEIMLISGHAGIGKTALVQEIHKPIVRQQGYFISGKFDKFQRNIPYFALVNAFSNLVQLILTESKDKLCKWQERILHALGINGQIIIDVIPDLELIIGPQPAAVIVDSKEIKNRFDLMFQRFIRIFMHKDHPLVIFLDDLQWADAASLRLIEIIMSSNEDNLFLICAYRHNEVNPSHPFMTVLEDIKNKGVATRKIKLAPLSQSHLEKLIEETLHCRGGAKVKELARHVISKTGGNPFFTNEFIMALYSEELLNFDHHKGEWKWSIDEVKSMAMTDNVVELMTSKLKKLDLPTQNILKIAAATGNQFTLEMLTSIAGESSIEIEEMLFSALENGLIIPAYGSHSSLGGIEVSNIEYKFSHDRIQQAAYTLIKQEIRPKFHLETGRLLFENTNTDNLLERIFTIVNQMNQGAELIKSRSEKDKLAELNLIAGQEAMASAAYEPSLTYSKQGLSLLDDDSWSKNYQTTLGVHLLALEAAYLCSRFQEMDILINEVVENAKSLHDKTKAYEVKISSLMAQDKPLEAVQISLPIFKMFGVTFPASPSRLSVLLALMKTKLLIGRKRIESLLDLPEMTDPHKLAVTRLISRASAAAYMSATMLHPLFTLKRVNLSVTHGNSSWSIPVYATYGLILCSVLGDIDTGYRFGQLALNLMDRLDADETRARTLCMVSAFVMHWKEPVRATLPPLLKGYQSGVDTGDFEFGSFCASIRLVYSLLSGKKLKWLKDELEEFDKILSQIKQETAHTWLKITRQAVTNLMNENQPPCALDGKYVNGEIMEELLANSQNRLGVFYFTFSKIVLSYQFYEFRIAIKDSDKLQEYLTNVRSLLLVPVYYFYDSLVRLALYTGANRKERKQILKTVTGNQRKMKKWARHAPMNFQHKYFLVQAEVMRVLGKDSEARAYYEQAVELSAQHNYINEEALAN
jgi:predicted ATPase/tRNA A-37 threonylcarbamoyl transferase component Bud32